MQPTLNMNVKNANLEGDTIYINQYSNFNRNDIVVARVGWYENYIIKRLVGVPGDKIEIKDETTHYGLYINNKLLYTKEKNGDGNSLTKTGTNGYYANYKLFLENEEYKDLIVHEYSNSYILLGENDYFVMGDNWGHTTDSIEKGPIKKSEIIGKVDFIIDANNSNPLEPTKFFLKKLFS